MNAARWSEVKQVFDKAVDLEAAERASYLDTACADDADLRREVDSLMAAHAQAGAFIEGAPSVEFAEALEDPFLGRRIGPYRVLAEIGRGGMGAVYRAMRDDDAYHKDVALKIVQSGLATEQHHERFLQERQILAGLDHPGIARLLDGGTTEDGRPYFVMELVEGASLDAYCERQRPGIRQRLLLFQAVCAAVEYAHRNLVVHRDLKPSNILVTPEGTPKLLDFGIAKLLRSSDFGGAATVTEVRALTPYYASPEQMRGESITTVSDVYSLGLLLYQLLTGRRPYDFTGKPPDEVLRLICEDDPPRPSELQAPQASELRGDLDVITMMALRKEPARRYGSVQELSEDIRRYLEDFPVRARPDSMGYRAGKFVGRHRTGIAVASVVVALFLAGSAATFLQWRRAESERARAESRFADVRRLANALIFEVHDEIQNLPGATRARESILKRALEYLDRLAREAAGDATLQRELAAAYERIGDVQGTPGESHRGDTQAALESQLKALAGRRGAVEAGAPSAARVELAGSYVKVGYLEGILGRSREAMANYRLALLALEGTDGTEPNVQRQRASALVRMGRALLADGQTPEAIVHLRQGAGLFEALQSHAPEDADAMHDRLTAWTALGPALLQVGRAPETLAGYRGVLAEAERFSARHPNDARAHRDVGVLWERLGTALRDEGELDEALALFRKCLTMDEAASKADPANFEARRDVSISYEKVGRVLLTKQDPGARAALEKTLEIRQAMAKDDPRNQQTQSDLSTAHYWLAQAGLKRKDMVAARRHMEASLRIDEALAAADPDDLEARDTVADTSIGLAEVLTGSGDTDAALRVLKRALAIREELLARDPENMERRFFLAAVYKGLGGATDARGQWREARAFYALGLAPLQELAKTQKLTGTYADWVTTLEGDVARCDAALKKAGSR